MIGCDPCDEEVTETLLICSEEYREEFKRVCPNKLRQSSHGRSDTDPTHGLGTTLGAVILIFRGGCPSHVSFAVSQPIE